MKPIKDTFIFKMQDKAVSIKSKMITYNPSLDDISMESIDEQILTIRKRYNYPAKNVILNDLGITIKPIFNKERITIPSYLPSYLLVNQYSSDRAGGDDKIIAVVNLTNYATYDKTKENLNIDAKQLFGLLQCGEILLTCLRKWNTITINQTINKLGSQIYSRMFVKILDKMYAVNYDPIKADKIKFLAAKFFLVNMLERTNTETIDNIAYSSCTNNTTRNTINQFSEDIPTTIYNSFEHIITQLPLYIDGLHGLTVRTFLDQSMRMYGTAILFAWEYFPMFIHSVASVVIGARLVRENVLEGIIGKEADTIYNEFVGLMR